jgi:acyl carrier protein
VIGEIYVGGEGLARGYLNRPELTAQRFIPDGKSGKSGGRLYRTGDLARYRQDGSLEYIGRRDHQVKLRGYRIEPGEIEAVLNGHQGVRQARVLVRETAPGSEQLVAYVSADDGITEGLLRDYLRAKIPEYMVPGGFVLLDEFPLTPNGKLDYGALPGPGLGAGDQESVAPQTAAERLTANIFAEVLTLDRVGVHDNFFNLGGHSLLAIMVIHLLEYAFGVELSLRTLFEAPTVHQLTRIIEERCGSPEIADQIASTVMLVDKLSDQEVRQLLSNQDTSADR